MSDKYLKMPTTTKVVIEEIKKMCSDYLDKKSSEEEIRQYLLYWKNHCGNIFYDDGLLNSTVKVRIGAKRVKIINSILKE